jgi:nitroimidazol reductase NimA-like FMN-containing flavoprotein (pyridoxamine 5'-phosphate oxidase superfamily)
VDGQLHDDVWIEYLDLEECWQLLAMHPVGRIALVVDDAPEVQPVNHAVDGRTIVFRTDDGTKLHAIARDSRVCFEVDGLNLDRGTGWSVIVKGRAVEVTDVDELARVRTIPLQLWGLGPKTHWVRIVPYEVTGRAIRRDDLRAPPGPG